MLGKFLFGVVVIIVIVMIAGAISNSIPSDPFPDGATYRTGDGALQADCEPVAKWVSMMEGNGAFESDTGDPNSRFWYLDDDNNALMTYETRSNGLKCMVGVVLVLEGEMSTAYWK